MIDITERKKIEEELKKYRVHLEELIESRTAELKRANEQLKQEVVERGKVEMALRMPETSYRTLLEHTKDAIFIADAETGMIVDANKKAQELICYSLKEICKMRQLELHPPEEKERYKEIFNECISKGVATGIKTLITNRNGQHIPVEICSSLIDIGGRRLIQGIFRDITEHKNAEEELKRLNEELKHHVAQLEAANKDLESFSYSVSHDLKAPLRAIGGFSNILLEKHADKLDDEGKRLFNNIKKNTQKMGQLIDDILSFARVGRKDIVLSEINMEDLANKAFDDLKPLSIGRNVQFEIKQLPPARGDKTMLYQVFTNLISNAIKFTRSKETAIIEIGGWTEGNENIYYVKDNGVGFDMQYVKKIFGVFQRLHKDEEYEGTGIGLALVNRIIDKHGGRVWAEGKINEGTALYFSIPVTDLNPN